MRLEAAANVQPPTRCRDDWFIRHLLGIVLDTVLNRCVLDNGWYTIATSGAYVGVAFRKVVVHSVRTVSVISLRALL